MRVKTGVKRRQKHKKILKATKGYWGSKNRLYKSAKEAYLHAGEYAFAGRKLRKRDMKRLWIMRINAGLKNIKNPISYSKFANKLSKSKIELNRKMLAEIAVNDPATFEAVVEKVSK